MSIRRVGGMGLALLLACGPQVDGTEPSASATEESSSEPTESSDECGALTEEACGEDPGCEPLLAQQTFYEDMCVGRPVFVGCRAADCVGEQPCWICSDAPDRQWATQCGCLPEPWRICDWESPPPTECECAPNTDCEESWKWCNEGACTSCRGIGDVCDCFVSGCAPGECCGWEAYCLGGNPLPDGSCSG